MVQSTSGNIILNCCKIHDDWVAKVEFLCKTDSERAQVAQLVAKPLLKDINVLHAELGNPSKVITQDTGRAMGLHLTGMLSLVKIVPWK